MKYIKSKIHKKVFRKLSHVKLFYKGFHNRTYLGFYNGIKVQIRLKINDIVNHEDEYKYLKNNEDYLFVNKFVVIKKWFDGEHFKANKESLKNLYDILEKFWSQNLDLAKMNWLFYKTKDPKYLSLVEKYKDDFNDVIHGDLNFKNILANDKNEVKLIDFEWIKKGSKYFDIICIYKNFNINKNELIKRFDLNEEKFDNYLYMSVKFIEEAEEKVYSKMSDSFWYEKK